jgi:hydroxyethylthiazole kinase-like uncharacterized protein yjeF
LPLLRRDAATAHERACAATLPPHTLMRRAGQAVARLARALRPHAQGVLLLAGPGNNGGDAWEAAALLRQAGMDCELRWLGDPTSLPPDAAASRRRALEAGVANQAWHDADPAPGTGLVIDGGFGRGLQRALEPRAADAVRCINAWGLPVLAIDVPTGLNADLGEAPAGGPVVEAAWTLSLMSLAPGLFTGLGRRVCGEIWHDDLACPAPTGSAMAWLFGHPPGALAPARPVDGHKGRFGDLHVIGGAPGMVGAAWLSARAALWSGAGRVHAHLLDPEAATLDPARPELMARHHVPADARLSGATVVCGCGGGEQLQGVLVDVLPRAERLVLDADALNLVATSPIVAEAVRQRAASARSTLLTPHPLEAARLLATSVSEVQQDRLGAAAALSRRYACQVLLKGSGSVLAGPDLPLRVNPTGQAALSTPGSGDVLAGWIGGWWAQAPAGATPATLADLVARAALLHGLAAQNRHPGGQALPADEQVRAMAARLATGA